MESTTLTSDATGTRPGIPVQLIPRLSLGVFLLAFLSFAYFYQSGEHNENARFAQLRAILSDRTLNIDKYLFNTADVIQVGDNFYPNKAPGMILPTLPVFAAAEAALRLTGLSPNMRDHAVCYLTALFSVGLCSALLCAALFVFLLYRFGSASGALLVTLAYLFGTIAFPYSTLFFGHQLTAALIFLAFWIIFFWHEQREHRVLSTGPFRALALRSSWWLSLAGLLLSMATSTEYPCALAVAILGVYALYLTRSLRAVLFLALGGLVGAIPLLAYNLIVSGQLFFITYSVYGTGKNVSFMSQGSGVAGVVFPSLEILYQITFGARRGLFVFNPWLLALFPGAVVYFRMGFKAEAIAALSMVCAFLLFNAGYGDSIVYWGGANSIGPRHIIPMLPFAAILVAPLFRYRLFVWAWMPVILYSAAVMVMATAVEPRVSMDYQQPLTQFLWPNYFNARFAALYYGTFSHDLVTANSVAFNLGKLLKFPNGFQLVPLFVFWGWGISALWLAANSRKAPPTGLIAILVALLTFGALPGVGSTFLESHASGGAGLEGTYFRGIRWTTLEARSSPQPTTTGTIEYVRADEQIDFDWSHGDLPFGGSFSVEWRGTLQVPVDQEYTLSISSDDGSALLLDGRLLIDNWGEHGVVSKHATLPLTAGAHRLIVRYYNAYSGAAMHLRWGKEERAQDPIDRRFLSYP